MVCGFDHVRYDDPTGDGLSSARCAFDQLDYGVDLRIPSQINSKRTSAMTASPELNRVVLLDVVDRLQ